MLPDRYLLPPMRELWSEESKYRYWLRVEMALLNVRVARGELARPDYEHICQYASFSVARINELDQELHHDLNAFVANVQESLEQAGHGNLKGEIHKGITSYDTEDPAVMLMLRKSTFLIKEALLELRTALLSRAREHQTTLYCARTHGQDAEPDTFGRLLLGFVEEMDLALSELSHIQVNVLPVAKFSGAVGTYAGLDPYLETEVLRELGLKPVLVSTQIVQRGRHATYISWIANTGACIERMARTFWEMMRSGVGELREPRGKKQKGSSAMAHKKNPILTERLMGQARLLRSYANIALENVATPECRDISQSSVERMIFPDSTSLLYYMLKTATKVVTGLEVLADRMKENLSQTYEVWASQPVRIALIEAGIDTEVAYRYVQALSFKAVDERTQLHVLLQGEIIPNDPENRTGSLVIGDIKLVEIFDPWLYIQKGIETIFTRFPD